MTVKRPILRYHGGKWLMAEWIIQHMPKHKVYCEPFGGGASVLLQKSRVAAELYNDLDGVVVNVFRVLQDPDKAARLLRRIELTPYARAEFDLTYTKPKDDVEAAVFTVVRSFMGHGTDAITRTCRTGFRAKMSDSRSFASAAWATWPSSVATFVERLRGVLIENRDASDIMLRVDGAATLFYVDPPYVTSTRRSLDNGRGSVHGYRHELGDEDHRKLAKLLRSLKGMVLLSGYHSPLYDRLYRGWGRVEREALADGARPRTEVLWFNPACARRMPQPTIDFEERKRPVRAASHAAEARVCIT